MNESLDAVRHFIAFILLLLPFIDWSVVYILRRIYVTARNRGFDSIAIRERGIVATILAVTVTLNAIIGFSVFFNLTLPSGVGLAILSISLIMVSTPNLYWLYLYSRNKLRR